VQYLGGLNYQGSAGGDVQIYQVDFSDINLALLAGTYAFGVSGPAGCAGCATPFLHASNGPLSGSPQMGDDGLFYAFTSAGTMAPGYPVDSLVDQYWDKTSDINVQVFVPEPSTLALVAMIALSLLGLSFARLRRQA
jgi:hypothetical protein